MKMKKADLEQELKQQKILFQKTKSLYLKHNERIKKIEELYSKQQKAFNEAYKLSDELSVLIRTFKDLEQEVIKDYE